MHTNANRNLRESWVANRSKTIQRNQFAAVFRTQTVRSAAESTHHRRRRS